MPEERQVLVERNDVRVMFKRVADEQSAISRGMAELEEAIGSLRLIAPAFEKLAECADRDRSRPGIEFYRRHDVVDLLLPVD